MMPMTMAIVTYECYIVRCGSVVLGVGVGRSGCVRLFAVIATLVSSGLSLFSCPVVRIVRRCLVRLVVLRCFRVKVVPMVLVVTLWLVLVVWNFGRRCGLVSNSF